MKMIVLKMKMIVLKMKIFKMNRKLLAISAAIVYSLLPAFLVNLPAEQAASGSFALVALHSPSPSRCHQMGTRTSEIPSAPCISCRGQ